MKRGSWTQEERVIAWKTVHRLLAKGWNREQICRAAEISLTAFYAYRSMSEPPRPMVRLYRGRKPGTGQLALAIRRDAVVPFEIAQLRDQLVEAFLRGDLDTHGRLTIKLKALLLARDAAPLLQAAE